MCQAFGQRSFRAIIKLNLYNIVFTIFVKAYIISFYCIHMNDINNLEINFKLSTSLLTALYSFNDINNQNIIFK